MPGGQGMYALTTGLILYLLPYLIFRLAASVFPGRFDVHIWADSALDLAVFPLKSLDVFPDQHQNMAVEGAPLVIGYKSQLFQHLFLYADGNALDCHKITPIAIVCVYFMVILW